MAQDVAQSLYNIPLEPDSFEPRTKARHRPQLEVHALRSRERDGDRVSGVRLTPAYLGGENPAVRAEGPPTRQQGNDIDC